MRVSPLTRIPAAKSRVPFIYSIGGLQLPILPWSEAHGAHLHPRSSALSSLLPQRPQPRPGRADRSVVTAAEVVRVPRKGSAPTELAKPEKPSIVVKRVPGSSRAEGTQTKQQQSQQQSKAQKQEQQQQRAHQEDLAQQQASQPQQAPVQQRSLAHHQAPGQQTTHNASVWHPPLRRVRVPRALAQPQPQQRQERRPTRVSRQPDVHLSSQQLLPMAPPASDATATAPPVADTVAAGATVAASQSPSAGGAAGVVAPQQRPLWGAASNVSDLSGALSPTQSLAPTFAGNDAAPALVVFSGGTAFNSVAGHLRTLTTRVAHVLPVSDDGGSTAEIVRVLGGPAVGDIRSRCLRLADDSNEEARAVKRLLGHRLDSHDADAARREWHDLVEGQHALWGGMSDPYKHTIRAFLVHFHSAILRHSSERFNFRNGSVGNFFFAGARLFLRSLEAAIFLFSRVARIPEGSSVLPAICTENVITLGAELEGNAMIRGQNNISHPPRGAGTVDKGSGGPPLPAPLRRICYLSSEGTHQEHEVFPLVNPAVTAEVAAADGIVYAMGSLYTSICPPLVLTGVGEAIAARPAAPKLLLLNGSHDRETGTSPSGGNSGMTVSEVVQALTDALNRRHSPRTGHELHHLPSTYVTHIVVPAGGALHLDRPALAAMGLSDITEVESVRDGASRAVYEPEALVSVIGAILT
eukprot:CAMPEP_0206142102 /NCGR_PEP_ID=MMETSP1473-20131121/15574_1 /ASSEMBLY_ACC=CAM_ASM_001109 /TAXON_ID=1461547 /ORGANISM="Stichococcus sp, Strain RCC1054" /LENGTH=694 /DNA_ID=CAMNT_0053536961 /DNA_START=76 /DNA_END=2156 /DNA_ORIENTATION=-